MLRIFRFIRDTKRSTTPVTFKMWFLQKVVGINKKAYWPVHHRSVVNVPGNILLGVNVFPGYAPRCYIQGIGRLVIDDNTIIEEGVGIISANHFMLDIRKHVEGLVKIGKNCRIGKNAIILPNVELGDNTFVLPNSIVKESFPEGNCVIGGQPATIVEKNTSNLSPAGIRKDYVGYIPAEQFPIFREKYLWV